MEVLIAQKKPVQVKAIQYTGENSDDIFKFCPKAKWGLGKESIYIESLEGNMRVEVNDYVIQGVEGEFYPCKPIIFNKTYDIVKAETF
jgi:hypothetical protein